MTTQERVLAALNHEEPDRVPIWTLIDNTDVLRQFAPANFDDGPLIRGEPGTHDALLDVTARAAKGLGLDVTFLCDTWMMDPFPRENRDIQAFGATHARFKSIADLAGFTPEIKPYEELVGPFVKTFNEIAAAFAPEVMLVSQGGSCVEGAHNAIGLELFSVAIYDAPGDIGRIMDAYTEQQRIKAQIYADHKLAPAYQVSCDIAFKGSTLFSPEFLRRELCPRLAREIEPVKQAGMKVILHCDGDVTGVLDELIEAGIDGLNPLEPTAGMDMAAVKKRYGKNLVLVGNADPNLVTFGSPETIDAEVKRCIRAAARGGGYFFDTGAGEIMPGFPAENVVRMCDAVHLFGRYPALAG